MSLSSVEDDGVGEELDVRWKVEPGRRILEVGTLPDPTEGCFDDPSVIARSWMPSAGGPSLHACGVLDDAHREAIGEPRTIVLGIYTRQRSLASAPSDRLLTIPITMHTTPCGLELPFLDALPAIARVLVEPDVKSGVGALAGTPDCCHEHELQHRL